MFENIQNIQNMKTACTKLLFFLKYFRSFIHVTYHIALLKLKVVRVKISICEIKSNNMRLKKDHFISSPSSCKYTEEIKMVKVKNTLPQPYS